MWNAISRNSLVNLAQFLISAALVFVMTPIYLRELGDYDYGIWQIIAALLGYANILDLGMQPTVARYVARHLGAGARWKLSRLLSTSLSMLLLLSLLPFLLAVVFAVFGAHVVAGASTDVMKYQWVVALVAAGIPITFARFVYVSFLEGIQRYDLRAVVSVSHGILFAVAFVTLGSSLDPLVRMAELTLIVGVSRLFWLWFCVRMAMPVRVRFVARLADRRLANELSRFGAKSFVQGVSTTVEARLGTLIVGAGLGPAAVVFYSLPQTLAQYVRNFGWTLSHAFMPAFSHLAGSEQHSSMRDVFLRGSRYVLAAVLPLAVGIAVLGVDFMSLWVGSEYAQGSGSLLLLLTAYFLAPFLFPLQSRYLTAVDQHGIFAKLYPVRAVANIVLSIILVQHLGLVGVALGCLIPELVVLVPTAARTLRAAGVSFGTYARVVWLPPILPTLALVLTVRLYRDVLGAENWLTFGGAVAAAGSIYVSLTLAIEFLGRWAPLKTFSGRE